MISPRRASICALTILGLAALGGCSAERSQLAGVRLNPTPEMFTLHDRHDDACNTIAYTTNHNIRALREDAGRVLLLDRPSRLTPEPVR